MPLRRLSGNFPFYGKEERDLFDKILRVEYSFSGSEWDDVSAEGALCVLYLYHACWDRT